MIALLLACVATEPIPPGPGFLGSVTDRWWSLRDAEMDFYLRSWDESVWYNIVGYPHADPSGDLYAGTWTYDGEGSFVIEGYSVRARVLADQPECYLLTYGGLRNDVACPYGGPLE